MSVKGFNINGLIEKYDYNALENKPSILDSPVQSVNGKTGDVVLNATDVGAGTYSKPSGGIPKTDLASAVQTSLDKADTAYQKPSGGIPASDLAPGVIPTIPTKTSDLNNDSGFVNAAGAAAAAPVQSVNGQTGAVTVQTATDAQVSTAVNTWCGNNVAQETGYVLDSSLTMSNAAAPADKVGELKSELVSEKLLSQSDLVFANSNFVVNNGKAYAVSVVSPYNCMVINANRIDFKYRRRSSNYSFYIGVAVDGKFVGNRTNAVVSEIKTLYDTTNTTYTDATVNTSVADDTYGTDYHDYSATLTGQVFELKKGTTTILKFTVSNDKTIQGIAFLNYRFDYYSTTDNTDFKDGTIITDKVGAMIDAAVEPVAQLAKRADIIGLQSNYRMVAGVIRNSGNGWDFIVNERHSGNMNCNSVSVDNNGNIVINYAGINATKVVSFVCTPDETFAKLGYSIGGSIGLSQAVLTVVKSKQNGVGGILLADNNGFSISAGTGVTSATWDTTNSRLVIQHESVTNSYPNIEPYRYGRYIPRIYSMSATGFTVEFWDSNTNTKVTGLSNKLSLAFSRINVDGITVNPIDASTIVSEAGNFWFMGIFET